MITKFENFITENAEVGTPIRRYFSKNSLTHENIIGKRVTTLDGRVWYINKISKINNNTQLPYQLYCSKRPNEEFGLYIKTDDLYVPDDIDVVQIQGIQTQIQESDQYVAKEIYKQLGGRKFSVMTGAKNLSSTENSLSFRIPRSKNSINYVKITLNSTDLYDVEYGKIYGYNYTIIKTENNIYDDMLVKSFEQNTGLHTKLF